MGLAYMRSQSVHDATQDLLGKIEDTDAFEYAFGCSASDMYAVQILVDANIITIARLMELVPPGTMYDGSDTISLRLYLFRRCRIDGC